MPTNMIQTYAPEYAKKKGISVEEATEKLEEHWNISKKMAKKKFVENTDEYWAYVTGIWKRMNMFEASSSSSSVQISFQIIGK